MAANVVDLFCGVGGMAHGFLREGYTVVGGVDLDRSCEYAFQTNNRAPFLHADVATLPAKKLQELYDPQAPRVLVGCAPCQPFSLYTNRDGPDHSWRLLRSFARLAVATMPDVVSMENVPRLVNHRIFREFVKCLEDVGYHVSYSNVRGPDYGIPQRRTRLVLFASGFAPIHLVPPTHTPDKRKTVRDAIGKLPQIAAGETCQTDPLHRARGLSPMNRLRLEATAEGGGWADWSENLRLACHGKAKGKTFRSVYGRMRWDEPSPVITTQCIGIGNGRFGHPSQLRALSLREAALLQTFPSSYQFVGSGARISAQTIARHIGNAVPVRLGRIIARSIRRHLEAFNVW